MQRNERSWCAVLVSWPHPKNTQYNATRLATLLVGGAAALSGAVTADRLTEFVL